MGSANESPVGRFKLEHYLNCSQGIKRGIVQSMSAQKPVKRMSDEELKRRVQGLKNAPQDVKDYLKRGPQNPIDLIEALKRRNGQS